MIPIWPVNSSFWIENQLLNLWVGKSVGGKSPEVPRHDFKVSVTNNEHFKAYDYSDKVASGLFLEKKIINY